MTLAARAIAARTGHPVLKLVLVTTAVLPGYPTVGDIADAAELPLGLAEDALADLVAAKHLAAHHLPGQPTRYALPGDGWDYTRADVEDPDAAPAPVSDQISGYAMTGRVPA